MIGSSRRRAAIVILVLAGMGSLVGLWVWAREVRLGGGDFAAYWSAAYLLRQGRDFYDPASMKQVQDTLVHTGLEATIMAWNPPSLVALLLPLAWLPFESARAAWLVANVIMVVVSCLALARIYLPGQRWGALAMCGFAIGFPQVLTGIVLGQVTFLVLLGLTLSVLCVQRGRWFWAGAALILTSAKPHMAILAAPYLLLVMAHRRRWAGWLGLLCTGAACGAILFALRPAWVADFVDLLHIAPLDWATPTLGGLLSALGITEVARYAIALFLPAVVWLAWRPTVAVEAAVAWLTTITVPLTFFGWSYDQSLLLIPAAQLFAWLAAARSSPARAGILAALALMVVAVYLHRIVSTDEVVFVWVPVYWGVVHGLAWLLLRRGRGSVADPDVGPEAPPGAASQRMCS